VKFGTFYNTGYFGTDPGNLAAVAQHAEGCGFESFYVAEHIVLYPGAKAGPVEFPADLAVADPLECLSFIAARTERIVLGTGVLLLPYHHPVVLAKRLATIDVLSAGRMRLLTVGLGGLPGEAHAVGADEAIEVLHLLWAGGKEGVSFTGEHFLSRICAASPSPTAPARCQSTSADRAGRRPAAPACAATVTSPAAGSPPPNARRNSISCGPPPPRRAESRARWNTPAGGRSA
jgi:alkanesulfonate monooxygenase SsuD/methylene tetrahydromethanopterin reductase-like flavin-dependent oxidoreductase (luciferase family)